MGSSAKWGKGGSTRTPFFIQTLNKSALLGYLAGTWAYESNSLRFNFLLHVKEETICFTV
jgi:hypothetical protein